MLRVQLDAPLPAVLRRDAWVPFHASVRNESNALPDGAKDARLVLAVELWRDEHQPLAGSAALLQVRDRRGGTSGGGSSGSSNEGRAAGAAGKARGGSGPQLTTAACDGRGRFVGELRVAAGCTRQHYQGNAHTPACLHRIRHPIFVRVTVAVSTWPGHPPASFLPVLVGPVTVLDAGAPPPPPAEAPAGGPAAGVALQRRTYAFAFGAVVTLERPTAALDGFGHVVWDAALLLARWLEQAPASLLAGRRVVEVGAGVGLVGLAAAARGAHVLLTDMAGALPLTELNAGANVDLVRRGRGSVAVRPLEWGNAAELAALQAELRHQPPDVLLASDVVYDNDLFAPLVGVLAALAGPQTTVLLAARERHGCDFDLFLRLLAEPFEVRLCSLTGEAAQLAEASALSKAKRTPHIYQLQRRPAPPASASASA